MIVRDVCNASSEYKELFDSDFSLVREASLVVEVAEEDIFWPQSLTAAEIGKVGCPTTLSEAAGGEGEALC